ncbi:hypothetical protein EJV47_20365 [Hymenobacter gummosus]|uniref:Uncharacterized protein n=1 Tax=Hymenobacter gummosus TaxID=1776032 RepID=A0A3S0JBM0_9BACT|nr:hypothetical protein [Hymenobacter gummosus]RTQ46731.1 hypothetical protein EJV47_20365 [Hymenobacter gummosus]
MPLWHLTARNISPLRLWRTGAYSFRVIEPGPPVDVLTNYDYVLFDRRYEGALRSTGAELQLTPVTVTDEVRQTVWRHYLEASIRPAASPEEIARAAPPGPVICRFGEDSVFVSEALKTLLQQIAGQKLSFTPGFSRFA